MRAALAGRDPAGAPRGNEARWARGSLGAFGGGLGDGVFFQAPSFEQDVTPVVEGSAAEKLRRSCCRDGGAGFQFVAVGGGAIEVACSCD